MNYIKKERMGNKKFKKRNKLCKISKEIKK